MTTHAAVLIQDWNNSYDVFYANMDGNPTSLGERLIRELFRHEENIKADPWTTLDQITEYLGLKKMDIRYPPHSREFHAIFTENITDLEWVYTVTDFLHSPGMDVYKTSNLVKGDPFIWNVWGRVLKYTFDGEGDPKIREVMNHVELIGDSTKNMLMELKGVNV